MPTGYSGTPLAKKLGIKDGMRVALIHAPAHYWKLFEDQPEGLSVLEVGPTAKVAAKLKNESVEVAHVFATEAKALADSLPVLMGAIARNGTIWVSWPKKASKVPTDITEDTIREVALPLGLVDVKVCAVDETWSGLKLVIRKELR
jgi:hypothetical protein